MSVTSEDLLVAQVLALPCANIDPSKWNLDVVLEVAVQVAGLVKKASASTKQENFDLLLKIVNAVIDKLEAKEISSIAQGSSTDAVVQRWLSLKALVNTTLPVVFSYTSHLSVPPVVANWFACFCADAVEIEEFVKVAVPVVEKMAEPALHVIDEIAVAAGETDVASAVEKVEVALSKVESVVNVVESAQ